MKINLVLPHQLPFPPRRGGGVENLNWLLAREFASRGNTVVAYSRAAPETPKRETDRCGIRHIRVKGYDLHPNRILDHINALRYAWSIRRAMEPADITLFHTPFSFLLCGAPRLGPCTHTIHRTPKAQLPLYRRLHRLYCGSDAVVAQARTIGKNMTNLKRIYNCIAVDDEVLSATTTGNREGLLFLYVGRFVPDKGIASLVKGYELALREFPGNRLETVGPQKDESGADGRFFEEMCQYVQSHNLSNRVTFRPPIFERKELNSLIASADVICVPSLTGETFSMAILEAMAIGKPVLVSDFGPMTEAVEHKITGYIARAGDASSMADGIRFFSREPAELAKIGRAGFEKARLNFSVERIASEYLEDFTLLIAGRTADCKSTATSPKRHF